jgi:hypothetical protein
MAMIGAISGIMGAVGSAMQGEAASAADKYNAATNFANADVVRQQTVAQATQQARENYLRLRDMHASFGKSGGTGGSFLDVLADTAAQGELAKQNIIYAGQVKATNLVRGGELDLAAATSHKIGGYLQAGSELTKGSSSYASLTRAGGGSSINPSSYAS